MMPAHRFSNPPGMMPPAGPYSHVVRAGDLVFLAGQAGADAEGVLAGDQIEEQTAQTLDNIRRALESEGLGWGQVVKLTLYVARPEDVGRFADYTATVFPVLFPKGYPATTLVVVQQLFARELLVEIDVIAHA